jgi:hypothetical protein
LLAFGEIEVPEEPPGAAADFVRLLRDVAEDGSFAASGSLTSMPVVDLPVFGRLPLPLDHATVDRLSAFCEQAPFGQGTETVIDTSVRNVLQTDATNITFGNPHFEHELNASFDKVSKSIGCDLYQGLNVSAILSQ